MFPHTQQSSVLFFSFQICINDISIYVDAYITHIVGRAQYDLVSSIPIYLLILPLIEILKFDWLDKYYMQRCDACLLT